tara:strand:+ start:520 stop:693 length:174 start_codon:yes stop_codon:yes gene_type:complete
MNKYLQLHIDQASQSTKRRFRMTWAVIKCVGYLVMIYAVVLSIWWMLTFAFALSPGM